MKNFFVIALVALALLSSCTEGGKTKRTASSGTTTGSAPWELLVVGNKEWLSGTYGSTLIDVVNSEIPGLPQIEPCFRVTTINTADFNNTFKVYANIVMADVNRKYTKAELKVARDVYAHPQIVMTVCAPTNEEFVQFVESNRARIIAVFVDAELTRERDLLKKKHSGKVFTEVKKLFGCELFAPQDINAIKVGEDFIWASSEGKHENNSNICVYSYPYTSTSAFTLENFLAKRDSFMRENVKGEKDNQYMSTDRKAVQSADINIDGRYVQEVRGLWQMENDMMGGPFVSYAQVDTVNNRVLVVEGFVYAPEKRKREFIRELEASLQTLVLPAK